MLGEEPLVDVRPVLAVGGLYTGLGVNWALALPVSEVNARSGSSEDGHEETEGIISATSGVALLYQTRR